MANESAFVVENWCRMSKTERLGLWINYKVGSYVWNDDEVIFFRHCTLDHLEINLNSLSNQLNRVENFWKQIKFFYSRETQNLLPSAHLQKWFIYYIGQRGTRQKMENNKKGRVRLRAPASNEGIRQIPTCRRIREETKFLHPHEDIRQWRQRKRFWVQKAPAPIEDKAWNSTGRRV